MLDIKRIREHYDVVLTLLERRGKGDYGLPRLIELDADKRNLLVKVEQMKSEHKSSSKRIPELRLKGEGTEALKEDLKKLSEEIKDLDLQISEIDHEMEVIMMGIPNTPDPETPVGTTDADNLEIRRWGEVTVFEHAIKPHWDIGTDLGILDFERATKITGTRFAVYKGLGARLERALYNFMLDLHTTEHHFVEIMPPYMVNRNALIGTGQLPKFEDDLFAVPSKGFYLIPTAEVPLTNLYSNEILEEVALPINHTALTPCFRKEAGAAGRDTRGLIRQHQFNKVELVKFVKPETSVQELETLLLAAEEVLKQLELPYRVVQLCAGDLGFASAKTYDIEVWMPSYNRYLEISSCSNYKDYQARRANIRYRDEKTGKVSYVHTLNGSGLAVGRTVAAILENGQQQDGSVVIPKVLRPYMSGLEMISL